MTAINTLDTLVDIAPSDEASLQLEEALDIMKGVQNSTDTASLGPEDSDDNETEMNETEDENETVENGSEADLEDEGARDQGGGGGGPPGFVRNFIGGLFGIWNPLPFFFPLLNLLGSAGCFLFEDLDLYCMSIEEELGEMVAADERIEEEVEESKSEVMELARVLTSAMEYINREEGEIVEIRSALERAREQGLDESEKDSLIASVERVESEIDQTRNSIAGLRESFDCEDLFSTMGMVEDKLESQIAVLKELQEELT